MGSFSLGPSNDLHSFIAQSPIDDYRTALSHFSTTELLENFDALSHQPILDREKKLKNLFEFIDSISKLELLGKEMSVSHFLSFLSCLDFQTDFQNKLAIILTGLEPSVFSQSLHTIRSEHLHYLKDEGLFEPLQYHLTQFVHEGENLLKDIEQKENIFLQNISTIHPEDLTPESLQDLINQIDMMRNQILKYLEQLSTALAIVWQTDRIDLIDALSSLNDSLLHRLSFAIGHPASEEIRASGLYEFLEKTFSIIFDASLKDTDSAMEGMTRLSIWHLKDYWELGLLPSIKKFEDLEFLPSSNKNMIYSQGIYSFVQKQLEQLHLITVADLKKAHLFSKSLIQNYIARHQHLLKLLKN